MWLLLIAVSSIVFILLSTSFPACMWVQLLSIVFILLSTFLACDCFRMWLLLIAVLISSIVFALFSAHVIAEIMTMPKLCQHLQNSKDGKKCESSNKSRSRMNQCIQIATCSQTRKLKSGNNAEKQQHNEWKHKTNKHKRNKTKRNKQTQYKTEQLLWILVLTRCGAQRAARRIRNKK